MERPLYYKKRILSVLLPLMAGVYLLAGLATYSRTDGYYRWQDARCVLYGVDPFAAAAGLVDAPAGVGQLNPQVNGNVPWTYLMTNLCYPAFLPYKTAMYVSKAVFVLLLIITIRRFNAYLARTLPCGAPDRRILYSLLLCSYMWFATLRLGNLAAFNMLLTVLLITFDHNEHPLFAGALYALILTKPQGAGLFLLYFLYKKRFRAILVAGGIVLLCTAAASLLTGVPMLTLVLTPYTFSVGYGSNDNYIYYGLLDPLISVFGLPAAVVMPMGAVAGIAAVTCLAFSAKSVSEETAYGFLALLSCCWMYSQPSDLLFCGLTAFAFAAALYRYGAVLPGKRRFALVLGAVLPCLPVTGRMYMACPALPFLMRAGCLLTLILLIKTERSAARSPCTATD